MNKPQSVDLLPTDAAPTSCRPAHPRFTNAENWVPPPSAAGSPIGRTGNRPRWPVLPIAGTLKLAAFALWLSTAWHFAAAVLFFGAGMLVVFHLLAPGARGVCRAITRFKTAQREIWLTIDDGPDAKDTPQILDLLDRHGAKATFFVIGTQAEQHRSLIEEILRRGHTVGHHTHTHPVMAFWCAPLRRVRSELDDAAAALSRAGVRPAHFRPPVGIKNLHLARELDRRGLRCVGWSVRSGDCLSRDAAVVVRRVMSRVQPGAIVLMHEGESVRPEVRVAAIARLLAALSAAGYRCILPDDSQLVR